MSSGLPPLFPSPEVPSVSDLFREVVNPFAGYTASGASGGPTTPAEQWVSKELTYYESSYTTTEDIVVSVTSFNVGCKKPQLPLDQLVRLTAADGSERPTDLLIVAMQEVDMSATAMFKQETDAATPWVAGLNAAVRADGNSQGSTPYYALPPKQLVGLLLCVFIRRPLLPAVREYNITTVATGALGTVGNKGAVGLHLVLHRSSFCILCAHLASGQANVSKRNDDINTIFRSMDFNATKRAEMQINANANVMAGILCPELYPRGHDFIIVAGDLNYRIALDYETTVQLATQDQLADLLKYDQLKKELANPHTPWQNFIDFTPQFRPTYRYDIGTDVYDTSEKRRVPSFTDRVLVWCRRKAMEPLIHLDSFRAITAVKSSDHKPIHAMLRMPLCVEVPAEKERVTAVLRNKVATMGLDSAAHASISVDVTNLDFGPQSFHHCGTTQTVTITNTGECAAVVRVVRNATEDPCQAGWLRVSPLETAILPGESAEFTIETAIDPRCMDRVVLWAPYAGRGRLSLSSALLFWCRNGNFASVQCSAIMQPSIFGNALDYILSLGALSCVDAYREKADVAALALRPQSHLPKELIYMADVIMQHPMETDLFTQSVDKDACNAIMEMLDTSGDPLPLTVDVHCVAECFLTFIKSLQTPVVPYSLYMDALAAGRAKGKAPIELLRRMPPLYANVWRYTLALLNFLLKPEFTASNGLDSELLAHMFSSVLLARPPQLQGLDSARLQQGGAVDQQRRQELQQEKSDAAALVGYFLTTPPAMLYSFM